MTTPLEILLVVSNIGGHLSSAGDNVRALLPSDCSPRLKDAIRQHKISLLRLLNSTFWIVKSHLLNEIVFFAPDDQTKDGLISAGAQPGSIYTIAELAALVNLRVTSSELTGIHAARRLFNGTVAPISEAPRPL